MKCHYMTEKLLSSGKFSNEDEDDVDNDEKDEEAEVHDEGCDKLEVGDDGDSNNNNNDDGESDEFAKAEVTSCDEKVKPPSGGGKGFSPNAPPFVPSQQAPPPPPPPLPPTSVAPTSRPNLFLYSPASNTMIPCEEIIIPNPVMGPEVGNQKIS